MHTTTITTTEGAPHTMTTTESTATATGPETVEVVTLTGDVVEVETREVGGTAPPADAAGEEKSSPGTEVAKPAKPAKAVEKSELTKAQARKLTNDIAKAVGKAADTAESLADLAAKASDLMAEAFQKKAYLALDFPSWEDYVHSELGEGRVKLDRTVRQEITYRLADQAKMSTRAIAPVLGVDQKTVSNDLRQVRRELGVEAATVQGTDGKNYSAPSTTERKPRKPSKPVNERWDAVASQVFELLDQLRSFQSEEDYESLAGQIAKAHRGDLPMWIDTIKALQKGLPG